MKIDKNGQQVSTLKENLAVWQNRLRSAPNSSFGNDFVIKPEGVVDNIATASSLAKVDNENQINYYLKQQNPNTAEGKYQDYLYALVGLVRRQATYTVVSRTCEGEPNTTIETGNLIIENVATKDQFRNNDPIQFGADGLAMGSFTAEEAGAIDFPADAQVGIVTPLPNLTGVFYTNGNTINIGLDYENDAAFRERWIATNSVRTANTQNGLYKALLALVSGPSELKIFSNRKSVASGGLPRNSQRIVLNSPYDDETVAETIFNNIVDGNMVSLVGEISVTIKDESDEDVEIKFDRATTLAIYIQTSVSIKDNVSLSSAQTEIKNSIMKFISNTDFNMGSKINANMFAASIYAVPDVVTVESIKLSTDGEEWVDSITLGDTQVATFDSARIQVHEAD